MGEAKARRRLEAMMEGLESMLRHRQAHPTVRSEEMGIPLIALDNDIAGPSFMPAEELRGKELEELCEMLEER